MTNEKFRKKRETHRMKMFGGINVTQSSTVSLSLPFTGGEVFGRFQTRFVASTGTGLYSEAIFLPIGSESVQSAGDR
eukprot:g76516.t1